MAWRYFAQRLPGGEVIDSNLPLEGVSITPGPLSGPGELTGTISVQRPHLLAEDGSPLLEEWKAAIWAEEGDVIRGGGVLADVRTESDGSLSVECVGFSGMLQEQPYTGREGKVWTQVDPLDVVREIWTHWQSFPDGDLGVIVDATTSPVRIGEEAYIPLDVSLSEADTTFDDGPIRLNWWSTHDLGAMIDDMVKQGYFDYTEETRWAGPAHDRRLEHRLRLHYPRAGRVRTDLRFAVGENILTRPPLEPPEDGYASEVMFLGAGEGREKIMAEARGSRGGLRRVAVVVDDTVKRQTEAVQRARVEAQRRAGGSVLTQIVIIDHKNAPLGSWSSGDTIDVVGDIGWGVDRQRVRVVSTTISPENAEVATLSVVKE